MLKLFIEQYYLNKDETIELFEQQDSLYIVTIVKKTARTYRKVAQLKITKLEQFSHQIPKELSMYKFSPKVKRKLNESNETIQRWLQEGWIVRELRYNSDGISVKDDSFRIGPAYITALKNEKQSMLEQVALEHEQLYKKARMLQLPEPFQYVIQSENLPEKWSTKKRLKFIRFCLAFYELAMKKDLFDFKEIGATLEDKIGGSKIFDLERQDFLQQLEENGIDPSNYGLVSIGKIVPIFFTGNASNETAEYSLGAVHATTDNSVLLSPFTTTNTTLWLVENRAILTRMATEVEFLKMSNSFILCLDGQIRSAHKRFIKQLLQSNIQQTIIWTDTDAAGLTIAKKAALLIHGPIKIIGRDFRVFTSIKSYEQQAIFERPREQEQQLGGVEQWKEWI